MSEIDWDAALKDYRNGKISRLDICVKYGMNLLELKQKAFELDIPYGKNELITVAQFRNLNNGQNILENSEITAENKSRNKALIRVQLLTARNLTIRFNELLGDYDKIRELIMEPVMDDEGKEIANVGALKALALVLEKITKIGDQICRIQTASAGLGKLDEVESNILTIQGGLPLLELE